MVDIAREILTESGYAVEYLNSWTYSDIESLHDQKLLVINGYSYTRELDRYIEQYQATDRKWPGSANPGHLRPHSVDG